MTHSEWYYSYRRYHIRRLVWKACGGCSETAGAAVPRRSLSLSWSLYCMASGVRRVSRGGFVFRLCAVFPLCRPCQSLAVSFFPVMRRPVFGWLYQWPAAVSHCAVHTICVSVGVSVAPRNKLRKNKGKGPTRSRHGLRGWTSKNQTVQNLGGVVGKPQRDTGIAAPTPEQYGSVRWVALTRLTRPDRMPSCLAS